MFGMCEVALKVTARTPLRVIDGEELEHIKNCSDFWQSESSGGLAGAGPCCLEQFLITIRGRGTDVFRCGEQKTLYSK